MPEQITKTFPRYRMHAVVALCLFLYGGMTFVFIHGSAHVTVTGRIANVYRTYGRGNHFTHFQIVPANGGSAPALRANYWGDHLAEGSTATVEFLQYNQRILNLQMLSGPSASWRLQEDGGLSMAYFAMIGGVLFLGFALWEFKTKAA